MWVTYCIAFEDLVIPNMLCMVVSMQTFRYCVSDIKYFTYTFIHAFKVLFLCCEICLL